MRVLCARGGGQGVCAAWPDLGIPWGAGCRAGTPVCALSSDAARSRERNMGVVSPIGTFSLVLGAAHTRGAGEGRGAAAVLTACLGLGNTVFFIGLRSGETERRGMSQPFQLNYKTNTGPRELGLFHPNWHQHQNPSSS